jgi:hypothetical protein
MSTTPVENLDRDKYPALVALTEELGAIQQAATRSLNGAAQKLVVDGVKTATKRVQGDPLQVQRYSDLGQDPALAARVKLPTAFQLKVGAKDYDKVVGLLEEHGWLHGVLIGNVRWYRFHRGVGFVLTGVGGS